MQNDTVNDVENYLDRFLQNVIDGLPEFLGALAILIIGYLVAKTLARLTRKALAKAGLNKHLHGGTAGSSIQRVVPNPSGLIASAVYWVIFLFGASMAIAVLGVPILNEFLQAVYGYLPNVIVAILIFMAAGAVSAAAVALAQNLMGDTPTGKVLSAAAPTIVMSLAIFMILDQLKIAETIVTITYAAIIGSAALGMALAFGLGGREVAATMLGNLYQKSQDSKDQIKSDARVGAERARAKGRRLTT